MIFKSNLKSSSFLIPSQLVISDDVTILYEIFLLLVVYSTLKSFFVIKIYLSYNKKDIINFLNV